MKEHTIEINYERLCRVQSQLDSILREDYVTGSFDLDDCMEELCHTICIYISEDMIQGEVPGVTGLINVYGGNNGRIIYTGRKLSEAKVDAMLAEFIPQALEELANHIEDHDDDREDNPAKPGVRAARAAEREAEKQVKVRWKKAGDVIYGYAHGLYSRDTLDKYIERVVEAVEADRAAKAHLHEIEQARKGRTGNPSHSGLPLGSVALGAALGAAAMHFTMKPKQ